MMRYSLKKVKILFLVTVLSVIVNFNLDAQIPYYAPTVGNGHFEAYTSLKIRLGEKHLGSYNSFQYGIGDYCAVGTDLTVTDENVCWGFIGRFGYTFSKYFKAGIQLTPGFNISNSFRFDNLSTAIYMNGAITKDEKLFWASNTFYNYYHRRSDDIDQWLYLGYKVGLAKLHTITPMIGTLYSWKFDSSPDIALGAYYSVNKFNFYLWGDDLLKSHPRVVVGLEVSM